MDPMGKVTFKSHRYLLDIQFHLSYNFLRKGPITERDFHVSKMVLWQWTTFAATGNPTPTEIPKEINLKLYTKMRGEKSARRKQPEGFTWTPLSAETKDIAEISSAWLMMGNSDYWNRVSSYSEVITLQSIISLASLIYIIIFMLPLVPFGRRVQTNHCS